MNRLTLLSGLLVCGIVASAAIPGFDSAAAVGNTPQPVSQPAITGPYTTLPPVTKPPTTPPPTTTPRTTVPPTTPPPTTTPKTLPPTTPPPTLPPVTNPPTTAPRTTLPPPPPPPTTPPPACPEYVNYPDFDAEVIATRVGQRCWSLIASGDSVTSAHNQFASGIPTPAVKCPNTAAVGRRGAGNDPVFSYASGVFNGAGKFAGGRYYNYARTGFSTTTMLWANAGTTDACGNAWGKGASPFQMVLNTAGGEKRMKRKVSWVTTGGVNNTNWSAMLSSFVQCSALQSITSANRLARNNGVLSLTVTPANAAPHTIDGTPSDTLILDLLLARGGSCFLRWTVGITSGTKLVNVPAFNLPATGPGITRDIKTMVGGAVAAGIEKITWVGYYDIAPATIDVPAALAAFGYDATLVSWIVPNLGSWGVPTMFPLARNAVQRATLHRNQTDLNTAICDGVTAGAVGWPAGTAQCTTWQAPGFAAAADIQSTVVGGMPHPSAAGHAKLKNMLIPRV